MATNSHVPFRGAGHRAALVLASLAGALTSLALLGAGFDNSYGTQGTLARVEPTERPTVQAAFQRQSYKPGQVARLVLFGRAPRSSLQIFRAGTERSRISPRDLMLGTAVSTPIRVTRRRAVREHPHRRLAERPLFRAHRRRRRRVGFAPFVLRPDASRGTRRRRRPPDPHVAGVQLPRRRRRRGRRLLVRAGNECATRPAPSRTAAFRLTTSTTTSPSSAGSSRRTATSTISRRQTLRRRPARRSRARTRRSSSRGTTNT